MLPDDHRLRAAVASKPAERTTWRRAVFLLLVTANAAGLLVLAVATLAPANAVWSEPRLLLMLCIVANAPWLALNAATGIVGFCIRMVAADPVAAVLPTSVLPASDDAPFPRTALAVCVRDEDIEGVSERLATLLVGLNQSGYSACFTACLLSDSADAAMAAREAAAEAMLRRRFGPSQVLYRRRTTNSGFKAGNVMEFLDQHASRFELMLCLDADSEMTAATVLRMVMIMRVSPRLAILQATFAGHPAVTLFPRLLQLGHRHGLRIWATGQAWWQADQGPYWGHNALLRIAPFRHHCRLDPLPDGALILSHDHVEAARLHAASWAVRVLPDDVGSHEEQPPSLPEFIRRDARWAAGNLQYRFLLHRRDLGRLGRLQMLQAILHYALTPFWLAMLPLAAFLTATGRATAPSVALIALLSVGTLQLYAPKLLGALEGLLLPRVARPFGGTGVVLRNAVIETVFTVLLDPILAVSKSGCVIGLLFGRQVRWGSSVRAGATLTWRAAAGLFWPHTLIGLVISAGFAAGSWRALAIALPATSGLVLAIPFAVITARPTPKWLREAGRSVAEHRRNFPQPQTTDQVQ